jgi:beta-galactosidase
MRKLLGIWAEEIDALMPHESNHVMWSQSLGDLSGTNTCSLLCDRIHAEGARVLATYVHDFYAGEPAVTVNEFGAGRAFYLATDLEQAALSGFLKYICDDAEVFSPLLHAPHGVEVMPRVTSVGQTQLYVLNHNTDSVVATLPHGDFRDLLSDETVSGEVELPRFGVRILQSL